MVSGLYRRKREPKEFIFPLASPNKRERERKSGVRKRERQRRRKRRKKRERGGSKGRK